MEPSWRLAVTDLDYTDYYLDEASVTFDPDTVTFIVKVFPPPGSKTYHATRRLLESYGKGSRTPGFTLQRWLIDEARNVVRLLHLSAYDADGKFIASLSPSNPADTPIEPMSVEEKIRKRAYALKQPTRSEPISQAGPKPPNHEQGRNVSDKKSDFTGEEKASDSGRLILYIGLAVGFLMLIKHLSNVRWDPAWGAPIKAFFTKGLSYLLILLILPVLGFIWIIVKAFLKVTYSKTLKPMVNSQYTKEIRDEVQKELKAKANGRPEGKPPTGRS